MVNEACVTKEILRVRKKHPDWSPQKIRDNATARCRAKSDYVDELSQLYSQYPYASDEGLVKLAYDNSNAPKDAFEDFCPYELLTLWRSETTYAEDFDDSYREYANLPDSIRVMFAVDDALPNLRDSHPELSEIKLLELAYDVAQKIVYSNNAEDFLVLDYSDFYDFTDDVSPQYPAAQVLRMTQQPFYSTMKPLSKAATSGKSTSTNVAQIGYLDEELLVEYNNGYMYGYDVEPNFYKLMASAPSKGEFVWNYLRGTTPGHVYGDPSRTTPGGVGGALVPYRRLTGTTPSGTPVDVNLEQLVHEIRGAGQKAAMVRFMSEDPPSPEMGAARDEERPSPDQPPTSAPDQPPTTPSSPAERVIAYKKGLKSKMGAAQKAETKLVESLKQRLSELEERQEGEREEGDPAKAQKLQQIESLTKALEAAVKRGDVRAAKGIRRQIKAIKRNVRRDFRPSFADYVTRPFATNQTRYAIRSDFDDFTNDMKRLVGPITREGAFEYDDGVRIKDFNNLKEVFSHTQHLPAFDSHNENELIGFAHSFEANENDGYVYAEVNTFNDIEDVSAVNVDKNTKFPVSIRYTEDRSANDGKQKIKDLVHLAISTNLTDVDRCSTGNGKSCYMQAKDFVAQRITRDDYMPKKKGEDEEYEDEEDESKDSKDESKKKDDDKDESDFVRLSKDDYESLKGKAERYEAEIPELKSKVNDFAQIAEDFRKQREKALEKEKNELINGLKEDPRVADFIEQRKIEELSQLRLLSDFKSSFEKPEKSEEDSLQSVKDFENRIKSLDEELRAKFNPQV